jgi:malonyl-CoA/methylmalonyl-CoA synthetase
MTIELVARAESNRERLAIVDPARAATYADLLGASASVATALVGALATSGSGLAGRRIAYLMDPGFDHVALLWGIWRAGGVAVPLALSHPGPEFARLIDDAAPSCLVGDAAGRDRLVAIANERTLPLYDAAALAAGAPVEQSAPGPDAAALMVYTSGTTGSPKGVVATHGQVTAQVAALSAAWGWRHDDRVLHVLPLHHVHGLQVALGAALFSGAACEFLWPFDASAVWDRFASGEVSVFMAVPTIYRRLVAAWEAAPEQQERWSAGAAGLRLMVSGSAALPVDLLDRWQAIAGQRLLERYGMTEIGMALSNPLLGERRAGTVGQPMRGVELRIVDAGGALCAAGTAGEIEVRGPQVFREYWCRPDETSAAFRDGWFRTGDEAVLEDGYYRIVGRRSVDIIKTGGYKVSALEIEEVLRAHPAVGEIAVVGVEDAEWGERVCAAIESAEPAPTPDAEAAIAVRDWARARLAPYKVPKQVIFVAELPRNAMGKVTKPALRTLFEESP